MEHFQTEERYVRDLLGLRNGGNSFRIEKLLDCFCAFGLLIPYAGSHFEDFSKMGEIIAGNHSLFYEQYHYREI